MEHVYIYIYICVCVCVYVEWEMLVQQMEMVIFGNQN